MTWSRRTMVRALVVAVASSLALLPTLPAQAAGEAAGDNVVKAMQRGTGAKLPSRRIPASTLRPSTALPASVDLRQWTVPIGDQGSVGSCVGWAIGYGLMGWHAKKLGLAVNQFSPTYVYSQINNGQDGGSFPTDAIDLIAAQGNDTIAHYSPGNYDWSTQPNAGQKRNASQYRAIGGRTLFAWDQGNAAINALKTELAAGRPVAITMVVRQGFYSASPENPVISDTTSDWSSSHEVLAVGYDSTGLIIQNSWGTWWGANGFGWVSWGVVGQDVWQADTITGLEPRGSAMHSSRSSAGSWSSLAKVANSTPMKTISASTASSGATFFVAIDRANQPYLSVRYVDGGWSSSVPISSRVGTNVTAAAVAVGAGSVSHVVSVSAGTMYYASRNASGSWTAMAAIPRAPSAATAVAASVDRYGNLHIISTDATGRLRAQYRTPAGAWSTPVDVTALGGPSGNTSVALAASPSGALHVSTVSGGRQYYLIRRSTGWTAPVVVPSSTTNLKSVAVAGLANGSAQFVTVTKAGVVYHQTRSANGSWAGVVNSNLYNVTTATIAGDGADAAAPKGTTQLVSVR